jgi:hypothetical protein
MIAGAVTAERSHIYAPALRSRARRKAMRIVKIVPTWGLMLESSPHAPVPWATGTGALGIHSGKWCHMPGIVIDD